jgi:hypothetical protein
MQGENLTGTNLNNFPIDQPMSTTKYTNPLNQLLQLGNPDAIPDWSAYLKLGITASQTADLSQMAVDLDLFRSEKDFEFWAPIHAWQALATLGGPAAIAALMNALHQLSDDEDFWDWVGEELPAAIGRVGVSALPALAQSLADEHLTDYTRENVVNGIIEVYKQHSDTRDDCVAILTQQLTQFMVNQPSLNGHLATALAVDFTAVESAGVIEQAYQAERVDEILMGDWNDAQVYLGLKERSEVPQRSSEWTSNSWRSGESAPIEFGLGVRKVSKTKAMAKRKLQNQSRKKNRVKKK